MEGDTQSRSGEHRKVVCTVAHGDGLAEIHLFHLCDEAEQLCLALSVDNFAHKASGQTTVLDFQLVGINVINAEAARQVLTEECESAA